MWKKWQKGKTLMSLVLSDSALFVPILKTSTLTEKRFYCKEYYIQNVYSITTFDSFGIILSKTSEMNLFISSTFILWNWIKVILFKNWLPLDKTGLSTWNYYKKIYLHVKSIMCHYVLHPSYDMSENIWAGPWENVSYVICEQQRCRLAVHPLSLISSFVVRCLDSIISLDSIADISRL